MQGNWSEYLFDLENNMWKFAGQCFFSYGEMASCSNSFSCNFQVKCMQCSYSSNKFDPFLDLSLEIVKADSLQKALTHFTAQEQLDSGERRYQCQQCKQKVQALKQLTIDKAPHVLTIHLKRFGSHVSGQKIDKKVQFGPTLNLKPFVSESYVCIPTCFNQRPLFASWHSFLKQLSPMLQDGELKYALYGVLVHAGWSTHSGHYYCFVRTSSGMWYSLDDSRVFHSSFHFIFYWFLFYNYSFWKWINSIKWPCSPCALGSE